MRKSLQINGLVLASFLLLLVAACGTEPTKSTTIDSASLQQALAKGCHAQCPKCKPGTYCLMYACLLVCPGDKAPVQRCHQDSDCALRSDYCGGCFCQADLAGTPKLYYCPVDTVQCFVDPCFNKKAVCDRSTGTCVAETAATLQ